MRISPITNNNLYTQKKQVNPNFEARIDSSLIKQMQGKSTPLQTLNLNTANGLLALPAALVAKFSLKFQNKNQENNSEVSLSGDSFYEAMMFKDEDGKTYLHKNLDEQSIDLLNQQLTTEQFVNVFTQKDKNGKSVFYEKDTKLKESFVQALIKKDMPIEYEMKVLKEIGYGYDVYYFLNDRLQKQNKIQKPVTNYINKNLYDLAVGKIDFLRISNAVFSGIKPATAAKLFDVIPEQPEYVGIDAAYLPYAANEEIKNLVNAAQAGSGTAFDMVCDAVAGLEPKDRAALTDKIIDSIQFNKLGDSHVEVIYKTLGKEAYEKLHRKREYEETLLQRAMYIHSDDSEFRYHYNDLKEKNPELLKELLLDKDENGYLTISMYENIFKFVAKEYKNDREMMRKIFLHQDNDGDTILHSANSDMVKFAFDLLNDEDLAHILSVQDNAGLTVFDNLDNDTDEFAFIKEKIFELATDSDLSIDDSIALLEANGMEPQIVQYLKLQRDAEEEENLVKLFSEND